MGDEGRAGLPGLMLVAAVSAASNALAGQTWAAAIALRRLNELQPGLSIGIVIGLIPLYQPKYVAVFADGLRKAGLPD